MEVRLTDSEWAFVSKYLSKIPPKKSWHGRPRADDRRIFEAILWLLATGSRWEDLRIDQYPAKSTCHRRFQDWARDGSFRRLHKALVEKLRRQGVLDFEEGFVDGTDVKAKKGAQKSPTTVGAEGLGSWLSLKHMVFRLLLMSLLPTSMRQAYLSQPWKIPSEVKRSLKISLGIKPTVPSH